jgi:hypothetical protein
LLYLHHTKKTIAPIETAPGVKVRRDADAKVRRLSHPQQYRPAAVDTFALGANTPVGGVVSTKMPSITPEQID